MNVWEGKVIRSAMGGHFCVPIYSGLSWSEVHNCVTENTQVFLANARPAHVLERSLNQQMALEDLQGTFYFNYFMFLFISTYF